MRKAPNDVRHRNVRVHEGTPRALSNLPKVRHDAVEASSVPFDGDTSRRSAATFTIRDSLPFGGSKMLACVSMTHDRGKPHPAPPSRSSPEDAPR